MPRVQFISERSRYDFISFKKKKKNSSWIGFLDHENLAVPKLLAQPIYMTLEADSVFERELH